MSASQAFSAFSTLALIGWVVLVVGSSLASMSQTGSGGKLLGEFNYQKYRIAVEIVQRRCYILLTLAPPHALSHTALIRRTWSIVSGCRWSFLDKKAMSGLVSSIQPKKIEIRTRKNSSKYSQYAYLQLHQARLRRMG